MITAASPSRRAIRAERCLSGMESPTHMPTAPPPTSWGTDTSAGTPAAAAAPIIVRGSAPRPATRSKGRPWARARASISQSQALGAQPHGVAHVPGGLDDHLPGGLPHLAEQLLVQGHLLPHDALGLGAHQGHLEQPAPGQKALRQAQRPAVHAAHLVQAAGHLVGHHRGAGAHPLHDPGADQLGDQGGDPLVQVGSAARDHRHLPAGPAGGHHGLHGAVHGLARPALPARGTGSERR